MAVLFELHRTNVKFKNVSSAKYQELELHNRKAQQWIFINVTRHSNSVHIIKFIINNALMLLPSAVECGEGRQ